MKGSIPPDLREKDVDYHFRVKKIGRVYKVEIGVREVEVDDETGEEYITFPTKKSFIIPLSKYPIDGKFPTGFEVDIDLKEMLDKLSEAEDSIELMDKGLGQKIIEEMMRKKEEQIGYLSTGKYAKKYGVTSQTVREWINKNKVKFYKLDSGQYRILDAPPIDIKEEKENLA